MSTRAAIARIKGDGFEGVYHHWDGYPTALGATLFEQARKRGVGPLLRLLIDEHPAGWSTINGQDLDVEPGFDGPGAECYCHGSRSEEPNLVTHQDDMGMEWAYVFDENANTMAVCERVRLDGGHAVGMFGTLGANPESGERDDVWVIRGVVALEGNEPPWEDFE